MFNAEKKEKAGFVKPVLAAPACSILHISGLALASG
jgi:hypothetical protein